MAIIIKKYKRLHPSMEYLTDEFVMAQAWKKSDMYIRQHNWYADILELDQMSLMASKRIEDWCKEIVIKKGGSRSPMRLVLAPKNGVWNFKDKARSDQTAWGYKIPVNSEDQKELRAIDHLRPLAHLGIREQTFATVVMLCLADAVESIQGNTDQESIKDAQKQKVYSYGNRLFCDWFKRTDDRQQARFRWGNATSYSQFFIDYERFLNRSSEVCREALGQFVREKLYVVKLDLSKFYDCVDRSVLIEKLEDIYGQYCKKFDVVYSNGTEKESEKQIKTFFESLESIMDWQWSDDNRSDDIELPSGLPQGMVASGFFANAYMQDYDQTIGKLIGINIGDKENSLKILDYCRYVDDMRVVVTASIDLNAKEVSDIVTKKFQALLKECFGDSGKLSFNGNKTEIIPWEDISIQGSTSRFMRGVQQQISQSPDPATLMGATGNLDQLLWLADTIDDDQCEAANPLALANIAVPKMDVRDDTIQRFAANRLRQVLKLRRSMADPALPINNRAALRSVSERQELDHEIEIIARKLIACWAKNPALTRVLRCGLDLFPSPDLLLPVLAALKTKLVKSKRKAFALERSVALYVLADLFKAGAVETGFDREECYPENSDIEGYRNELTLLAIELVSLKDLPWFVKQQAALYLAVMHYPLESLSGKFVSNYNALHKALKFELPDIDADNETNLSFALIALHMTGNKMQFHVWLTGWLSQLGKKKASPLVKMMALCDSSTLIEICDKWKNSSGKGWLKDLARPYLNQSIKKSKPISSWRDDKLFSLKSVANHPENPFVQENALLSLAIVLLEKHMLPKDESQIELNENLSLKILRVKCLDWSKAQSPDISFDVETGAMDKSQSIPWGGTPKWCSQDMAWAYHLGRILRSAIIGKDDFTTRFFPLQEVNYNKYRGFKSTWYKRRLGLMPLSVGLGSEPTPIAPWMCDLIMGLLQWPGLEVSANECVDFDSIKIPSDLLEPLKKRKKVLDGYYGSLSDLPVYLLPASDRENRDLSKFKVATVQPLMPLVKDISSHDPTFWNTEYRARHRAHTASMCRLLTQQLYAKEVASEKGSDNPMKLDLIVFPELTVHPDDMWILKRLSDQTGATIFAGQTFVQHDYLKKPINRGVWLLRQENKSGRHLVQVYQGKQHGTDWEVKSGVAGHRPYQVVIEFKDSNANTANLSGVICYDSTDLRLAADLRAVTDGLVISALNQDINTFDTMVRSLQYHMYQHVILANSGEYGGSTAQAPYKKDFERLISHVHGNNQAVVSVFAINLLEFKNQKNAKIPRERKTPPAGYDGRV